MKAPARVEVLGGTGTLHREGGLVCWFAPGFPPDLAVAVLDAARSVPTVEDPSELSPVLAAALGGSPATFFVVQEGADAFALALQGRVVVSEDGIERLRGSEGAGILRADIAARTSLTVRGGADPELLDRPGSIAFDLRDGTVPGGGVTFWPSLQPTSEEPPALDDSVVLFDLSAPEHPRQPLPIASVVVAPEPAASEALDEAAESASVPTSRGSAGAEQTAVVVGTQPSAPVEEAEGPAPAPTPADAGASPQAPLVQGLNCARGHFNNPRALYCGICGLAMVQNSVVVVRGRRPPLGVLLGDDGNAYSLDGDYVLGRQPELAEDVTAGRARPLKVDDGTGRISRVHARVALPEWEVLVTDLGSHNGTQVFNPGDAGWRTLRRDESVVLQPGGRLVIGQSTFEFQSIQRQ